MMVHLLKRSEFKYIYIFVYYIIMKLLYLHDGREDVGRIAIRKGFDVVVYNIDDFDQGMYAANHFDVLWVRLSCEISGSLNTEKLEYALDDLLYFYELKHWIIEFPDKRVYNDIAVWGVPFTDISFMSWGKIEKIRIYNNVFRWRPSGDEFYITRKSIVKEILCNLF